MVDLERALVDVAARLDAWAVPYMVIGGMANAVWGEPRATLDIDITVWTDPPMVEDLVRKLTGVYASRSEDPIRFVRDKRVLPLDGPAGVRVDIIFAMLPYEQQAIERAVVHEVEGYAVRFCSAEDLIIQKIISDREQDAIDAREITRLHRDELDVGYLRPLVAALARDLDKPELTTTLDSWLAS